MAEKDATSATATLTTTQTTTTTPVANTDPPKPPPPTAACPLPIRHFQIPTSATTTTTIRITEPRVSAANLPLETWASSTVLAAQLHHLSSLHHHQPQDPSPPPHSPIPVLELGAGTGLVGLAASRVLLQHQGGRQRQRHGVVLTDLPAILPALEANIALNDAGDSVVAGELDWACPDRLVVVRDGEQVSWSSVAAGGSGARLIVAADTVYDPEHPGLVAGVVGRWLGREARARFLLGTALRVAYLDEVRELWERLEGIGLECESEGKGMAEEGDFDDERLVEWSLWRWRDLRQGHTIGEGES